MAFTCHNGAALGNSRLTGCAGGSGGALVGSIICNSTKCKRITSPTLTSTRLVTGSPFKNVPLTLPVSRKNNLPSSC